MRIRAVVAHVARRSVTDDVDSKCCSIPPVSVGAPRPDSKHQANNAEHVNPAWLNAPDVALQRRRGMYWRTAIALAAKVLAPREKRRRGQEVSRGERAPSDSHGLPQRTPRAPAVTPSSAEGRSRLDVGCTAHAGRRSRGSGRHHLQDAETRHAAWPQRSSWTSGSGRSVAKAP